MITRPFTDPEFLKSRIVIPFDAELDAEARRDDEREASMRFANAEKIEGPRGIGYGLVFCALCFITGYLVWCA